MALGKEETILTAVAATSSQTSSSFIVPAHKYGLYLYMDVTAGSTLLLDMRLDSYLPGPNVWQTIFDNHPSAGGITGISLTALACTETNRAESSITNKRIHLGGQLRVFVTHGNATASTYKVYVQYW